MSQENVELVRRGWDAFVRRDVEVSLEILDPNVEYIPDRPDAGTFHGPGGVVEAITTWAEFWDDYSVELVDLIDAGDKVVTVVREHGHLRESGIESTGITCLVSTVKGGRIVRVETFSSKERALASVGLS
jgi:ketosteroid isomerase-like protein